MKLINYFSPRADNLVVTGLLLSSMPLQGGPSGFTLLADGAINRIGQGALFGMDKTDTEWSFDSDFIQETIAGTNGHPILFVAARHTYAFGPSVSDIEADLWTHPIREHPDAIMVFEMISMCWMERRHWVVKYNSTRGIPYVTQVYEIDSDDTPDPRFDPEISMSKEIAKSLGIKLQDEKKSPMVKGVLQFKQRK